MKSTRTSTKEDKVEQIDLTALALAALDAIRRKQQEEQNNETK